MAEMSDVKRRTFLAWLSTSGALGAGAGLTGCQRTPWSTRWWSVGTLDVLAAMSGQS